MVRKVRCRPRGLRVGDAECRFAQSPAAGGDKSFTQEQFDQMLAPITLYSGSMTRQASGPALPRAIAPIAATPDPIAGDPRARAVEIERRP